MDDSITLVLATYRLNINSMSNFIKWNQDVFLNKKIKVVIVCDRVVDFNLDWVKVLEYPVQQSTFSIGRTVNYGIKRVEGDGIIIKTDPDIFFTDEVLEHVKKNVSYKKGMICKCANRKNVECAKSAEWSLCNKRNAGRGACFAMTKRDWHELKGYDERIVGWGGDDFEMYRRASSRITIVEDSSFPLYHINHPDRRTNDISMYFFVNSKKNVSIGKPMNWNNCGWGEAMFKEVNENV